MLNVQCVREPTDLSLMSCPYSHKDLWGYVDSSDRLVNNMYNILPFTLPLIQLYNTSLNACGGFSLRFPVFACQEWIIHSGYRTWQAFIDLSQQDLDLRCYAQWSLVAFRHSGLPIGFISLLPASCGGLFVSIPVFNGQQWHWGNNDSCF